MWSDESETVESGVIAVAHLCIFGGDAHGSLNRPLEGLAMRGHRICNQLASPTKQCTAMEAF